MGIGYILVLTFIAYAALKFYKTQKAIEYDLSNRGGLKPGVSYYCNLSVTHRQQQVQAFTPTNSMQVSPEGYAPAFGPTENMPPSCREFYCGGAGLP